MEEVRPRSKWAVSDTLQPCSLCDDASSLSLSLTLSLSLSLSLTHCVSGSLSLISLYLLFGTFFYLFCPRSLVPQSSVVTLFQSGFFFFTPSGATSGQSLLESSKEMPGARKHCQQTHTEALLGVCVGCFVAPRFVRI